MVQRNLESAQYKKAEHIYYILFREKLKGIELKVSCISHSSAMNQLFNELLVPYLSLIHI